MEYCLITFRSTHLALRCEQVLKEKDLTVRLIPVPRQISSSCGLAARLPLAQAELAKQMCQNHQLEYECMYRQPGYDQL